MNFSEALEAMKAGKKVTCHYIKEGWIEIRKLPLGNYGGISSRFVYCSFYPPFIDSKNWCFFEFDDAHILAEDWEIVEERENNA